ncbi:uncharacterized protein [Periplaneta americana]|uniref:uncharacterized protein n=1 Tax=Periplaneta americana TaxID=6978 RepID=UPI0037E8DA37
MGNKNKDPSHLPSRGKRKGRVPTKMTPEDGLRFSNTRLSTKRKNMQKLKIGTSVKHCTNIRCSSKRSPILQSVRKSSPLVKPSVFGEGAVQQLKCGGDKVVYVRRYSNDATQSGAKPCTVTSSTATSSSTSESCATHMDLKVNHLDKICLKQSHAMCKHPLKVRIDNQSVFPDSVNEHFADPSSSKHQFEASGISNTNSEGESPAMGSLQELKDLDSEKCGNILLLQTEVEFEVSDEEFDESEFTMHTRHISCRSDDKVPQNPEYIKAIMTLSMKTSDSDGKLMTPVKVLSSCNKMLWESFEFISMPDTRLTSMTFCLCPCAKTVLIKCKLIQSPSVSYRVEEIERLWQKKFGLGLRDMHMQLSGRSENDFGLQHHELFLFATYECARTSVTRYIRNIILDNEDKV